MKHRQRVELNEVARILATIAAPPNLRDRPRAGDLGGDFDRWFDGGAIRFVTGYTVYQFTDGTRATVPAMLPHLSVALELATGQRVTVVQNTED